MSNDKYPWAKETELNDIYEMSSNHYMGWVQCADDQPVITSHGETDFEAAQRLNQECALRDKPLPNKKLGFQPGFIEKMKKKKEKIKAKKKMKRKEKAGGKKKNGERNSKTRKKKPTKKKGKLRKSTKDSS